MPTMPTPEAIAAKELVEGADLDFKREVDLDDGRQRSNLVDDVVSECAGGPHRYWSQGSRRRL